MNNSNTKLFHSSASGLMNENTRTHPHTFRITKQQKSSYQWEMQKRKSVQIEKTLQTITKPYLKTQLKDFLMKSQHQFNKRVEEPKIFQLPLIINTNREQEERRPPSIRKIEQFVEEKSDFWTEIRVSGRIINTRAYHSAVFYKDSMIIFGGRDNARGSFGDVSKMDRVPHSEGGFKYYWEQIQTSGQGPEYLSGHSSVILGTKMYVFGGRLQTMKNSGILYALDLESFVWEILQVEGDTPIAVDGHTMVPYYQTKAIVFGGFNPKPEPKSINAIQIYDCETNIWKNLPANAVQPRGRSYHSATMMVRNMWIFSGMDGTKKFGDLWFWNEDEGWNEVNFKTRGPEPRFGHISFNDGSHIFIFSGSSNALCEKNDLWSFNIEKEQWTQVENGFEISQTENMKDLTRIVKDKIQRPSIRKDQLLAVEEDILEDKFVSERNLIKFDMKKNRALEIFLHQRQQKQLQLSKSNNSSQNDGAETKDRETKQQVQIQDPDGDDKLLTYHKKQFLSTFEMDDNETRKLLIATPTTSQMRQSIIQIENPIRNRQKSPQNKFHQILNVATKFLKKKNVRPLPRDGATIVEGYEGWILFGGDRYKVTFNDAWLINRDELIKYAD